MSEVICDSCDGRGRVFIEALNDWKPCFKCNERGNIRFRDTQTSGERRNQAALEELRNESAFPHGIHPKNIDDPIFAGCVGLTKREMFAAMAFHALLTDSTYILGAAKCDKTDEQFFEGVAISAVGHSDALLAQLTKEKE